MGEIGAYKLCGEPASHFPPPLLRIQKGFSSEVRAVTSRGESPPLPMPITAVFKQDENIDISHRKPCFKHG